MVYTTYRNGDDWGTVNMTLFYPHHYCGWLQDPAPVGMPGTVLTVREPVL